MKKFSKKIWVILLIVTGIILGIMAASAVAGSNSANSIAGSIVAPLEKAVSSFGALGDFADSLVNSGKYKGENEALRERIASLEQATINIDTYRSENERLRSLLELKETRTELNYEGANVIARESGDWYDTIVIDKGRGDGVRVNSVAIVQGGLVGSVFEVGADYAKIKTVNDVESSVGAICGRTNDIGLAEGKSGLTPQGKCSLNYLDKNAKIVVGDNIETSGMGGIFPKGLHIGRVTEVVDSGDGLTISCEIETAVDFGKITEVLVSVKD